MDLPLDGREYARWTISSKEALPDDPPEVSLAMTPEEDEDPEWTDWLATEWGAAVVVKNGKNTRVFHLLIAGPDADPGTATVLAEGTYLTRSKATDNPEIIARDTEEITVG